MNNEHLKRAKESFLEYFNKHCDGLIIVDAEARIVWMNEHYPKLLEIPDPESYIGRPITDAIPKSKMGEVIKNRQAIMLDIMEFHKKVFVVTRIPLLDDAGKVEYAVGMVLDNDAANLAPLLNRYESMRDKLAQSWSAHYTFDDFVGNSPKILDLKKEARIAARSDADVLILGDTGTGKEVLAQAIHNDSSRSEQLFVAVNCTAIAETQHEAELFGYAPYAFTGCNPNGKKGKFVLADGGTLFLDEIGDMPLSLQAKLLRTLEERKVLPMGSNMPVRVNVRVIAATHRNLKAMIEEGKFREDLYYRLDGYTLVVPPLRERLGDLPDLCRHHLNDIFSKKNGWKNSLPIPDLSEIVVDRLSRYDWPGNVRELLHVLDKTLYRSNGESLELTDLERFMEESKARNSGPTGTFKEQVAHCECKIIRQTLDATGGNVSAAAELLDIDRSTLNKKMKDCGINSGSHRKKD